MDTNTVRKIAHLARLAVPENELEKRASEIAGILKWIEQMDEVNTDNVEPLANVANIELTLRPDAVTDGDCQDKVLANAPESVQGYYVVPKVVEQES
ncbi:MAG: Asp-tRNA(Asn)/Glu-tRNA(Gln) amidotransferase subunit GatC [Alphaproteobacteria bacterium]|nr:Asp-tRNA(Asn)/Glu-tRNA(Gln) amidotransferase subunit GatC [Alphaproteobacteria bacterium]